MNIYYYFLDADLQLLYRRNIHTFSLFSPTSFGCTMSVFSTLHLRPYTPSFCRTCLGSVSEESRSWYIVGLFLIWQYIVLDVFTNFSYDDFCNEMRKIRIFYINIYVQNIQKSIGRKYAYIMDVFITSKNKELAGRSAWGLASVKQDRGLKIQQCAQSLLEFCSVTFLQLQVLPFPPLNRT